MRVFMKGKRRRPVALLKCRGCGQECNGLQGIRGHLRSCPGRKPVALNQQYEPDDSVVQPGTRLVRAPNQQITLGSRLNADAVEMVLRIYEPVRASREQLRDSLPIRLSLDSVARANNWPTYDDWFNLGRDVVHLELATEEILQRAFVSRDQPWALYQLAIQTRDRWVSWRREEAHRTRKQRNTEKADVDERSTGNELEDILTDFGIPELEANWNRVIEGLRWLTSHTKATL